MKDKDTIAEVAQQVLLNLGKPASVSEILQEIQRRKLYEFNTPTPDHVLRTTIRRHTGNVERADSSAEILFEMVGDDVYGVIPSKRVNIRQRSGGGMKRIQRANDKEEIIKLLITDQLGVFKEIWKLLLFAAQVGVRNGRREPLGSVDSGKGIDQTTFGNCPAWPGLMYLMALTETESTICMSGAPEAEDIRISVFQEYANGGLSILQDFFASRPADLDGLLAFIESQREEAAGQPDLELTI